MTSQPPSSIHFEFFKRDEEPPFEILPSALAKKMRIWGAYFACMIILVTCIEMTGAVISPIFTEGGIVGIGFTLLLAMAAFPIISFLVVNLESIYRNLGQSGNQNAYHRIRVEIEPESLSLSFGARRVKTNWEDLNHIKINEAFILFEKEGLIKGYIPKRACENKAKWEELVQVFEKHQRDKVAGCPPARA